MNSIKLLFSALTVVFGILGLTRTLSYEITMPITFVCMSITMFITAKEYNDKKQKTSAICFFLLGIFLLLVTIYNISTYLTVL